MKRKIIQVSCSGVDNVSSTQCSFIVIALCNDGTVWQMDNNTNSPFWFKLPDIPQNVKTGGKR